MSTEGHHFKDGGQGESTTPAVNYLTEVNKTLVNDYRTSDGKHAEACSLIAIDIARILLAEGKKPKLVLISGKTGLLKPIQYGGRVSWGGHTVCVCEGLAYDPMIGRPLPINEYIRQAFGSDVEVKTTISEEEMDRFIKR
jgi:hypothetical protein